MTPLQSIVAAGTKLWLDSVDPDEIARNRALGATGATSNPIIISDLLKTGRFDADIKALAAKGHDDESIAWAMTDKLVKDALNVAFDTATALELVTLQSEDHREALAAIAEKRPPRFQGR